MTGSIPSESVANTRECHGEDDHGTLIDPYTYMNLSQYEALIEEVVESEQISTDKLRPHMLSSV